MPFKTITGPDWVQSLRRARERRSGQGNRLYEALVRLGLRPKAKETASEKP